jgi:hypothetical protein
LGGLEGVDECFRKFAGYSGEGCSMGGSIACRNGDAEDDENVAGAGQGGREGRERLLLYGRIEVKGLLPAPPASAHLA